MRFGRRGSRGGSRGGGGDAGRVTLHVGDPRFDDWPVVGDYEDLATAGAFCGRLREAGFVAEITSDWPLDHFGRGDIALRVPRERASEAEDWISDPPDEGYDPDDDDEEYPDWLRD